MYRLYHHPICPVSRSVRVLCLEKAIDIDLMVENFWERRDKFIKINPSCSVPFLASSPNILIYGFDPIVEYIEEVFHDKDRYIFGDPMEKAEIRKIIHWVNVKMYEDATKHILNEKIYNFLTTKEFPNASTLKICRTNLSHHLMYLNFLLTKKEWLGGNDFSLADIVASCHISSLDYINEINWDFYKELKDWYVVIKSKPSFRQILRDSIPGFTPSPQYRELDF